MVDANKARLLSRSGLSLTAPTTNKHSVAQQTNQVIAKQLNPRVPLREMRPQETRRKSQQRQVPHPQQQKQPRGQPQALPPHVRGTPADILKSLSSPTGPQQTSPRGAQGRMPPPSRGALPAPSRSTPPLPRGRGLPTRGRQPLHLQESGQKRRTPTAGQNGRRHDRGPNMSQQPRSWPGQARSSLPQPGAWVPPMQPSSKKLQSPTQHWSSLPKKLQNHGLALSVSTAPRPPTVPVGVTIAAPRP